MVCDIGGELWECRECVRGCLLTCWITTVQGRLFALKLFNKQFIIQFNCLVFSQLVPIDYVLFIVLAGQKSSCFSLEPDP